MQKLHLVGFSAELDGLIFSLGKGSDEFVVDLDGNLLQTIAEAERRRDRRSSVDSAVRVRQQARSGHASELSPRELQDRLRAGWSIEEVAKEAGTDVEWVSRFAAPVRAEQSRVVARALGLTFDKARLGPSALPLGRSVLRNLGERGVRLPEEEIDESWGAYQMEEGLWVVRFSYTSRGRAQEAEWLFDLDAGELSARNRLASQLGHVPKGRARHPVATVTSPPVRPRSKRRGGKAASPAARAADGEADAGPPSEAAAPAEELAGGRRATAAKKAGAKPPAPGKKAATKKRAVTRKKAATTKKTTTKKTPAKKTTTKKTTTKKTTTKKAPAKKAPPRSRASAKKAVPKEAPPAPAETITPPDAGSSASAPGDAGTGLLGDGDVSARATGADRMAGDELGWGADGHGDGESYDPPDPASAASRGNLRFEPKDPIVPIPMPPVRPPAAARPPARGPAPAREPVAMPIPPARREPPAATGRQAQGPPGSGRIFRRPPPPEREPDAHRKPRPEPQPKPQPKQRQTRRATPPGAGSPPVVHGPLPPPAPVPVPGKVREAVAEPIGEPPPVEGGAARRRPGPAPSSGRQPGGASPAPSSGPGGVQPEPDAASSSPSSSTRRQPRAAVFRQDLARPAGAGGPREDSPPAPTPGDRPSGASGQQVSSALDALAALRSPSEHDQASSARGRRRRRRRS